MEYKLMHTLNRRILRSLCRILGKIYYNTLFERSFPFSKGFGKILNILEAHAGIKLGDQPTELWENQYMIGKWDYLSEIGELARYSVIVGYIYHFKECASILDVGCGEGVLADRLLADRYSKYVGIDISKTAINKAKRRESEKNIFINADAEEFIPDKQFDIIVFNESLYVLKEPSRAVSRYIQYLGKGGVLIMSNYAGKNYRSLAVARRLRSIYHTLDEVTIINGRKSWICSVLKPTI